MRTGLEIIGELHGSRFDGHAALSNQDAHSTLNPVPLFLNFGMLVGCFKINIIYMKKFLHFDWLRAVQFLGNTVPKEIQCQKRKFSANFFRF